MTASLLYVLPWFDWLLIVGATLRLTRLLITDDLGKRLFREPLEDRLIDRLPPRAYWLVDGLSCPFCVGFWLGWAVLAVSVAVVGLPVVHLTWEVVLAALTLNYLTAHIGARLDPNYDGDDTPEPTEGDR